MLVGLAEFVRDIVMAIVVVVVADWELNREGRTEWAVVERVKLLGD